MAMNIKGKRGLGAGVSALAVVIGLLNVAPALAQTQTGDAFMDSAGLTSKNKVQTDSGNVVASASARPSPVKGPDTYLMSAFPATSQNSMSLFTSYDGATFTSLATEAYKPSTLLRDPSIIKAKDGYYYVVYTTDWSSATFGITRSKDLKHWEHITDVNIGIPGITNTWAPEWFQDSDGQIYVVVSLSKGGIPGPFAAYLLKATDIATGKFTPAQVMTGLENNHIDTFPIKANLPGESGKYYVFTKNETNKTIELASATSLTGPWTIEKTGNWAGWGDWIEGPALVRITGKDGKPGWRIYFDEYRTKKYWYSDSFDGFKTWTPRQELNGVTGAVRHFTVLKQTTAEVEAATAPKGKPVKVTWDKHSLMLDGKRQMIWAGEFHPFRLPSPSLWRDILQKMKATGYNTVSLYFDWGYHSPKPGSYDFTGVRDLEKAIQMAEDEGLYVIIRPGPYVNAELTMGGFPGWLARQKAVARTDDPEYIKAMEEWQTQIDTIVARHQITTGGGKVIAFQIENELSDTSDVHKRYMKILADKVHADGITVPIFHNSAGRLPNWTPPGSTAPFAVEGPTDLYAFDGYPGGSCTISAEVGKPNVVPNWGLYGEPTPAADGIVKVGQKASPNTPGYAAEIGGGWFDYWGSVGTYDCTSKRIGPEYVRTFFGSSLINGLSMHSVYTAFGGTSWGWLPASVVYTSYDYGVGIDEARRLRPKEFALKQMGQFIQSATPLLADLDKGTPLEASSPNVKLY
ncbi:MAG TPA: beta-galactosidase, partial [Asticcacaulis sp.]|nr:beta-galactosidase [Asticcacaulis sp.]